MNNFQIETAQNISIHQNVAHVTTRLGSFLLDLLIIICYIILLAFLISWLDLKFGMQQWAISLILSLPILFYTLIFETLWTTITRTRIDWRLAGAMRIKTVSVGPLGFSWALQESISVHSNLFQHASGHAGVAEFAIGAIHEIL